MVKTFSPVGLDVRLSCGLINADLERVTHRHFPALHLGLLCRSLPFCLGEIIQSRFGDGDLVGLEALTDELATHTKPGIVRSGWNVADQICILTFLPVGLFESRAV